MHVLPYVAVFAGAGCGALLRWGLGVWLNPLFGPVPLGTVAANLIGGLLVGAAGAAFAHVPAVPPEWRLFILTGFLGGLTTFSTFSAEVVAMLHRHEYGWALGTASLHLVGSLVLTLAGFALAQALLARG